MDDSTRGPGPVVFASDAIRTSPGGTSTLFLILMATPMLTESETKRKLLKNGGAAALRTRMYWSSLIPGLNCLTEAPLFAYEHKAGEKTDQRMPPGMGFLNDSAQAFLDGLDYPSGRPVSPDRWADVFETLGTI